MNARLNELPNRPLRAVLAVVAVAALLFGAFYLRGQEQTRQDTKRCAGTAVPHDIARSPQHLREVESCIKFAGASRWGPWGAWRRNND